MTGFVERSERAIGDLGLRRKLDAATRRFVVEQEQAIAELADAAALKERARAIKAHTLGRLPDYLEQLEARLTDNGAHVHWAPDAASACRIVVDVARGTGAASAVKAKSMTTEEIRLNEALSKAGIEVFETDLGEYIVQLAGEPPSHIITPAIHKSKDDIAELFRSRLGLTIGDSPEELTSAARQVLRERFLAAGIGVSGANFAVAENGTLVIVENEGNARLCTTLPRVHVAIVGIEKVLPRLSDLDVFLRLLPRSATGQKITSYVSWLRGPRGSAGDGPEELHVVFLDNGRSAMLADPELREALYCIRCGACLNACPIYRRIGGHAYGSPYPGPIGSVVSPLFQGPETAGDLPFASTLCGACRDVCPLSIDLPRLLLAWRHRLVERGVRGGSERRSLRLWSAAMRGPIRYRAASRILRLALRLARRRRWLLPGLAASWTGGRELPEPARESFRDWWARRTR